MLRHVATISLAISAAFAAGTCPGLYVSHDGTPAGEIKNVSGIEVYHSYPPGASTTPTKITEKAILFLSDIYGLPLKENKLLADSLARANYTVIFPDYFRGDAVPATSREGPALNLTEWQTRHPQEDIDNIIVNTVKYMREELGIKKIGGVGYCFGGKYVPRHMADGKGIDAGFIAHPSNLMPAEIEAIAGPISIAAGELDNAYNKTGRRNAEDILQNMNATYQTNLYAGAPHGFAVRPTLTDAKQKYAKEASFFQAVTWFNGWL